MVAEMKRRVVGALHLRGQETVADVGCGDGYYTIPLARELVSRGKVLAVDIDEVALSKLNKRLIEEGMKNVETIKGKPDDPLLPGHALDGVLIVNAYHEMPAHEAILRHVRDALKAGGVLVLMEGIWEKRENQSRDEQTSHHQLAPTLAKREIETAGFEVLSVQDPFLERASDEDGKSRWWLIVARAPATAR
jgi:ubiquinone/menaquinone biosynthesis C-methylase UbiE